LEYEQKSLDGWKHRVFCCLMLCCCNLAKNPKLHRFINGSETNECNILKDPNFIKSHLSSYFYVRIVSKMKYLKRINIKCVLELYTYFGHQILQTIYSFLTFIPIFLSKFECRSWSFQTKKSGYSYAFYQYVTERERQKKWTFLFIIKRNA
jgi:hypothetical protein